MIRSKAENTPEIPAFPLLAENIKYNFIVLFINTTSGIVLNKGNCNTYEMGEFASDWASCFDSTVWRIFKKGESIQLIQE